MDSQNNLLYGQELKFGELMLKRAGRELDRLQKKIQQQDSPEIIAALKTQYEQLYIEMEYFESELRTVQSQINEGNWSVS